MTAGRSVGNRIREACQILETHGPMGSRSICDRMADVSPENAGKYCLRAVGLGLMTVERGRQSKYNYSVFTVVPNWRDLVDKRRTTRLPAPKPRNPIQRGWAGIRSVFGMSA